MSEGVGPSPKDIGTDVKVIPAPVAEEKRPAAPAGDTDGEKQTASIDPESSKSSHAVPAPIADGTIQIETHEDEDTNVAEPMTSDNETITAAAEGEPAETSPDPEAVTDAEAAPTTEGEKPEQPAQVHKAAEGGVASKEVAIPTVEPLPSEESADSATGSTENDTSDTDEPAAAGEPSAVEPDRPNYGTNSGVEEIEGKNYGLYSNIVGDEVLVAEDGTPYYRDSEGKLIPYQNDATSTDPEAVWYKIDGVGNRVNARGAILAELEDPAADTDDQPDPARRTTDTGSASAYPPPKSRPTGTPRPARTGPSTAAPRPTTSRTGASTEAPSAAPAPKPEAAPTTGGGDSGDTTTETKKAREPIIATGSEEAIPPPPFAPDDEDESSSDGGRVDDDSTETRADKFLRRTDELNAQIKGLMGDGIRQDTLENFSGDLHTNWQELSTSERREVLETLQELKTLLKENIDLLPEGVRDMIEHNLSAESYVDRIDPESDFLETEIESLLDTILAEAPEEDTDEDKEEEEKLSEEVKEKLRVGIVVAADKLEPLFLKDKKIEDLRPEDLDRVWEALSLDQRKEIFEDLQAFTELTLSNRPLMNADERAGLENIHFDDLIAHPPDDIPDDITDLVHQILESADMARALGSEEKETLEDKNISEERAERIVNELRSQLADEKEDADGKKTYTVKSKEDLESLEKDARESIAENIRQLLSLSNTNPEVKKKILALQEQLDIPIEAITKNMRLRNLVDKALKKYVKSGEIDKPLEDILNRANHANEHPEGAEREKIKQKRMAEKMILEHAGGLEKLKSERPVLYGLFLGGQFLAVIIAIIFDSTSVVGNMGGK